MPTLAQWLQRATASLNTTSPTPRLDAEVLARTTLKLSPTQLIARANDALTESDIRVLDTLLARRAHGEPVAHIVGVREFWSLPLKVTADVLIPRPETELLVELALQRIPRTHACVVADLGTGSGALAVAIAHERPRAHVIATDISAAALAVAQANAQALNLNNIEFRLSDWCDTLHESCTVIVSNPPYVCAEDPHLRQGDVRFEPRLALTAGDDGLTAIRAIAQQAPAHLSDGGALILEHGYDQQAAVLALLRAHGFTGVAGMCDLSGVPRAAVAYSPARAIKNPGRFPGQG